MPSDWIVSLDWSDDCDVVQNHYAETCGTKIRLRHFDELKHCIPQTSSVWIDAGIDALHRSGNMSKGWKTYIEGFENGQHVLDHGLAATFERAKLVAFTKSVMDACAAHDPAWITIPQVPLTSSTDGSRNKVNKAFAQIVGEWRDSSQYGGRLMLPLILYGTDVLDKMGNWKPRLKDLITRLQICSANGVWVVCSDLKDEDGSGPNERTRLPGLAALHEELHDRLPGNNIKVVAGPYWAMALILWARGLVDHPLVDLGAGYRYTIPGSPGGRTGKIRIAIPSLRRRVVAVPQLAGWLQAAAKKLRTHASSVESSSTPSPRIGSAAIEFRSAADEFERLSKDLSQLALDADTARQQVSRFYRSWLDAMSQSSSKTRSLSLRQDFSAADLVGSIVGTLPKGTKPRHAGRLARQYMQSCV